jgi:hypothetical protein
MKQFDLEQQILQCWHVCDDLDMIHERVMEGPDMESDELSNLLLGMKSLYHMKFERCFSTFEEMLREQHQKKQS